MLRILVIFLLVLPFSLYGQKIIQKSSNYRVRIKIPSDWVERVKKYDYKQNNSSLLLDFDSYIKPLTLDTASSHKWGNLGTSKSRGGFLNPMFVDLDDEYSQELICLMGWDEDMPSIGVFKKIKGSWYLLYLEPFYMWYDMPEMYVANTFSRNKTFYFRRLYDRGSGVYSDGYSFYKLIHNSVYHCLELVNDAHNDIWGMNILQNAHLNFRFDGSSDVIIANYDYSFELGGREDCSDPYCEPLPFLDGKMSVSYRWDSLHLSYKLDHTPTHGSPPNTFNEKKIACFGAFGADSLFASAFCNDINNVLKTGTPLQNKLLNTFLRKVKHKK